MFIFSLSITFLSIFTLEVVAKGCVQLDSYSFHKVISKFGAALIKFDTVYPYGPKHDAFEAVCEAAFAASDLLIGEVQVKDYGEKDNDDLAKTYSVSKDDFPAVKLFLKGKDEPINFTAPSESDFSSNNLKRFLRSHVDVYIGLPGCLEEFDKLVSKFVSLPDSDEKKSLLAKAEESASKIKDSRQKKSADTYVKIMKKMVEKGPEFILTELSRVENLLKGKLSEEKQTLMQERVNILQSFTKHDEL